MEFIAFPKQPDSSARSVKYSVYLSSNADASSGAGISSFVKVATFEYYSAGVSDVILGDLDGDGEPTVSDAVMVLQSVVDVVTLDEKQTVAADVDKSGVVDVSDAVAILQYVVDVITSFDDL